MPNGTGTIVIRRSKTDQAGEGATAYLSRETVRWLAAWLGNAGIRGAQADDENGDCLIFGRLIGKKKG